MPFLNTTEANQQQYQSLCQALSLELRRQLFVVVCDDYHLRQWIFQQLQEDMALLQPPTMMVALPLTPEQPNFLISIAQWLENQPHPPKRVHFHIVNVEGLGQASLEMQDQFLRHLRQASRYLTQLQFNLVVWVSRPWRTSLEAAVPEFWRWHTGMFPFEGEPSLPLTGAWWEQEEAWSAPGTTIAVGTEGRFVYYENLIRRRQEKVKGEQYTLGDLQDLIALYREGSAYVPPDPGVRGLWLNDLGNLYWLVGQAISHDNALSRIEYAQQAIASYQEALEYLSPHLHREDYALVHRNLGNIHWDLARYGQPVHHLRQAIHAFHQALPHCSPLEDAEGYALLQHSLGLAYASLSQQETPQGHLQGAIHAYREALGYLSPQQDGAIWGAIQNNLGTAHWQISQHQNPLYHLQLATQAYKLALQQRQSEQNCHLAANTENNLGLVYWQIYRHYAEAQDMTLGFYALQEAAQHYQTAMALGEKAISQSLPLDFDRWTTRNNLAAVYYQLGRQSSTDPQAVAYLERAVMEYAQLLPHWPPHHPLYQSTLSYAIQSLKLLGRYGGLQVQSQSLNQIPPEYLTQILGQL